MILRLLAILDHFQWENDHNSLQQSWITIENGTFDISKKVQAPSICLPKQINGIISDVRLQIFFSFLVLTSGKFLLALGREIGTGSIFLPFIFTFEQGGMSLLFTATWLQLQGQHRMTVSFFCESAQIVQLFQSSFKVLSNSPT